MMKKIIILLLMVVSPAMIYTQIVQSETGIQLARSKAAIVGEMQQGISGSSATGGGSSYSPGEPSSLSKSSSSMGSIHGHTVEYKDFDGELKVVFPKINPHPLRYSCAQIWNSYYEKEGINIKVSTRGHYNESVVFFCPNCYNDEHFVKPFLDSEYEGMTGMDRIRSCGYEYAVFRGGRGLNEVVVEVSDEAMIEIPPNMQDNMIPEDSANN